MACLLYIGMYIYVAAYAGRIKAQEWMNASIWAFLSNKILFILPYPTNMAHLQQQHFDADLAILNMLKA